MADAATTPRELLARANEALANADWASAQELFSEALEQGDPPGALEGLGKAAFFLGEGEARSPRASARMRSTAMPGVRWTRRGSRSRSPGTTALSAASGRFRTGGSRAPAACST